MMKTVEMEPLQRETDQLVAIIVASINTARGGAR
jgi:hypothetical protein